MKDSYTFSKQTIIIVIVVLILVIAAAAVGGVRHMDYMKKHCDTGGSPASGFTPQGV